ncbi:hypothetical protein VHEMI06384 [[Torrubiella] hemipterigena]|uniref:A to I editase domain-containing protein n=1 Tax=[Torrubiella] hemipterigena TaxID=1531966 RepID=A0A0A1TJ04_9HYPO|nr:hypothetical protein VHEMI06384 [[Torrubiella] hemipterigena]
MSPKADAIAEAVLSCFDQLPVKRKPAIRDNGLHEWVPLSGIVAEKAGKFECLALATGMKCLPATKMASANGAVLHDWHAEILAIRAFNRYLLDEIINSNDSILLPRNKASSNPGERSTQAYVVDPAVKLHMYCSEAPCGDASMELTMGAQDDETSWDLPQDQPHDLPGRAYFSRLGIVRRKPARNDAPVTLSKSCSDKMSLKQFTSLLSSATEVVISPENAYIDTVVLPESQFSDVACQRAFSATGRLSALENRMWDTSHTFQPFTIATTTREFQYSKRSVSSRAAKISASNLAAVWTRAGLEESTINGIIQGRKLGTSKSASETSRRLMWAAAERAMRTLAPEDELHQELFSRDYESFKSNPVLDVRRRVKGDVWRLALTGWLRNEGDTSFSLEL